MAQDVNEKVIDDTDIKRKEHIAKADKRKNWRANLYFLELYVM